MSSDSVVSVRAGRRVKITCEDEIRREERCRRVFLSILSLMSVSDDCALVPTSLIILATQELDEKEEER